MKWKPISTLRDETSIFVARITDGHIEQLMRADNGFPYSSGTVGWSHWCEQPEIPHPSESWPVDAKVFIGLNPDCLTHKRHFKEYREGRFYVFDDCRSSWTTSHVLAVSSYPYAKLAEDGE